MNDEQKPASQDVTPDTPPAAWDQKALSLAENAYQRSNAHAFRDRGFHVSVMQSAILKGMRFAAPQPPALGGEPVEPWYYYADCADPDYSCLCNNEADALTEVADHGGSVVKLWNVAPDHHLAPLQAEIERLKETVEDSKQIILQQGDAVNQLKARCDFLEALLRAWLHGQVGVHGELERLKDRTRAALSKPAGSECCLPTAEEKALLAAGDCTPEELWGGSKPTCPKCIGRAGSEQI